MRCVQRESCSGPPAAIVPQSMGIVAIFEPCPGNTRLREGLFRVALRMADEKNFILGVAKITGMCFAAPRGETLGRPRVLTAARVVTRSRIARLH